MLPLRIFAVSILVLMVSSAAASPAISMDNSVTVKSHRPFDYIVVIIMENWNVNETYNCGSICDPFLTPFADAHAFSVNFKSTFNGSLTSYFALTMAQHNSPAKECTPDHNGTPQLSFCPQSSKNVADLIEGGGLTWKVYAEDYPLLCGAHCSPVGHCYDGYDNPGTAYAGSHNPFVYYTDIVGNSTRCSRIVRANSGPYISGPETDDYLLSDLGSTDNAPNFMWLIPNECDQMHHLCGDWGVSDMREQGSMYLQNMVPKILASNIFQTQRAALFITYDECQNIITITDSCNLTTSDATNRIYGVWASSDSPVGLSVVKQNFKSNLPHNHYSFLHTLEWAWNLPPLTTNDATATIMKEFFT